MSKKRGDLWYAADAGYEGKEGCNYLYSSPAYYAYYLGKYFRVTGRARPHDVRMSRGYSIRASDMIFRIIDTPEGVTFSREG